VRAAALPPPLDGGCAELLGVKNGTRRAGARATEEPTWPPELAPPHKRR
jgi:hypothetical protein